jgi:hypothetical protein
MNSTLNGPDPLHRGHGKENSRLASPVAFTKLKVLSIESSNQVPQRRGHGKSFRSLSVTQPFYTAIFIVLLHWLGFATFVTAAFLSSSLPHSLTIPWMTGSLIFSGVMWIIGILKRRQAYCPLCRGTPLIDSRARVHEKAKRIWPFNHGMTALLSIIATHKFRCMYCGSEYDMLKDTARRRRSARKHRH